jgi:ATP-dependent DNA helicase RecQ
MTELLEHLQTLLLSKEPDHAGFQVMARKNQPALRGVELARSHIPIRLSLALQDFIDQRAGTSDVAVLLRQAIRTCNQRLVLPQSLWHKFQQSKGNFGLRISQECSDGTVELDADPWSPTWLAGTSAIDVLEERRHTTPAAGDGILYAMTGWHTYQSEAQKASVHAFLLASPGSTLLVNLPTGGGKSLCLLLPAWTESRGGRIRGGSTLVIVPTVSLAMDQERQSRQFFQQTINEEFTPQSQTSDTSEEKRITIRQGLRNGTLPVLYLAPEALLHSELYQLCLDAAAAGTLTRLVIDEAHLIETWGATFRVEFQLLATYRKKLLEASNGNLRTLLLSATTSSQCEDLLQKLFSEKGHFSSIQSNQLRTELSYWFNVSPTLEEREKRVCEALRYLPRPLILYTTRPDDAMQWERMLRHDGFERVATFTGKTDANERRRLMSAWSQNQLDIMVATSAFGLGVDKRDIRTIVHTCLPENTDRYYQEVGRAGRDGCSAISLMCMMAQNDIKTAFTTQSRSRITPEKALERWQGMRQQAKTCPDRGDVLLVDIDAPPRNKPEMKQGEHNRDWNWHTILLMQRAGLLALKDPRSETHLQHTDTDSEEEEDTIRLEIELLASHLEEDLQFLDATGHTIEAEKQDIQASITGLYETIKTYASGKSSQCLAHTFARNYSETALACGGCPFCRQQGYPPYTNPEILVADLKRVETPVFYELNSEIQRRIGKHQTLHVQWDGWARADAQSDGKKDARSLEQLHLLLVALLGAGFQQYIIPHVLMAETIWVSGLIAKLAEKHATIPHLLLPDTWIVSSPILPLFALPTIVVYPLDNAQADRLYCRLQQQLGASIPRVHIISPVLYLASEQGYFKDRVNGLSESMSSLSTLLRSIEEEEYF